MHTLRKVVNSSVVESTDVIFAPHESGVTVRMVTKYSDGSTGTNAIVMSIEAARASWIDLRKKGFVNIQSSAA